MPGEPIIECMYGWGQVVRLYQDHLEVNGTFYRLDEFISVRPVYRRVFGVSSVRLELRFKRKAFILRGIAAVERAEKIVQYLNDRRASQQDDTPTTSPSPQTSANAFSSAPATFLPTITNYESLKEHAQAPTIPVVVPRFRITEPAYQEQRGYSSKRSQREYLLREHGFDVEQVEQLLQTEGLPQVQVPVRLLPDECAHYRTEATLSGEPLINSPRYRYRVKDQGMLIFTNKRIIYLGRKCQIVLGYARLLHVSRLQGAIAFLAEHWTRREIFEVRHPLECAMYLECILKRFQRPESLLLHEHALRRGHLPQPEERPYDDIADSETISLSMSRWELSETPVTQKEPDPAGVSEIEK
ncbi:MAG TPA: hypothetical protein VKR06_05510 [Ktedonosporobacter sp.]|nr:hypothetical protein [Ktedonosporobacter sp.]